MPITVPQPGQDIDATLFGAPVANQLNSMAPTAWTNVVYQNSWTTQTGMGTAQYRKEGDIVRLRGVIMGGALGTVAFTLPTGFRPPSEMYITGGCWSGSTWLVARIVMQTAGNVTPTNGMGGANVYWPIDFQFSITA